jgi:hypothetical protein
MFSGGAVDFARQGQGKLDRLAQAMAEFRDN